MDIREQLSHKGLLVKMQRLLFGTQETQIKLTFDYLLKYKHLMLPLSEMEFLAAAAFQLEGFQELVSLILKQLALFQYSARQAKRVCKIMVLIQYLLKHGPSAFIDEFTQSLVVLKGYQQIKLNSTSKSESELEGYIQLLSNRANKVVQLLQDKYKLAKQKQFSLLLKRRLEERKDIKKDCKKKCQKGLYYRLVFVMEKLDRQLDKMDEWLDKQIDALLGLQEEKLQAELISMDSI